MAEADTPQTRGDRLRDLAQYSTDVRTLALLDEAARTADRLDELDRVIAGKGVLQLLRFRMPQPFEDDGDERHITVEVRFDNVLSEARQQQTTLRALLVSLGLKPLQVKRAEGGGSILDQLAARRQEREARERGAPAAPAVDASGVD